MKRQHRGPAVSSSQLQKTAAAGECFFGEKVDDRIPVEAVNQDRVQYASTASISTSPCELISRATWLGV